MRLVIIREHAAMQPGVVLEQHVFQDNGIVAIGDCILCGSAFDVLRMRCDSPATPEQISKWLVKWNRTICRPDRFAVLEVMAS